MIDAYHRGLLNHAVQEKLLSDIDARLLHLETAPADEAAEEDRPGPADKHDGDHSEEDDDT